MSRGAPWPIGLLALPIWFCPHGAHRHLLGSRDGTLGRSRRGSLQRDCGRRRRKPEWRVDGGTRNAVAHGDAVTGAGVDVEDAAVRLPSSRRVTRRRGTLTFLRDVAVIIVVAVLVAFLVKTFIVRSFYIPSGSMETTLMVKDRILVDELTPRINDYERGDIIVFRDPGGWLGVTGLDTGINPFLRAGDWVLSLIGSSSSDSGDHLVKRIIGLPGDHVVCCNELDQLTVNGTAIDETSYINVPRGEPASRVPFDVVVPADSLWVLGDNRDRSKDSRLNQDQPGRGFVPIENVVGRAFTITWPLNRFGLLDSHDDVFVSLLGP